MEIFSAILTLFRICHSFFIVVFATLTNRLFFFLWRVIYDIFHQSFIFSTHLLFALLLFFSKFPIEYCPFYLYHTTVILQFFFIKWVSPSYLPDLKMLNICDASFYKAEEHLMKMRFKIRKKRRSHTGKGKHLLFFAFDSSPIQFLFFSDE